jgi:hypothetical protein
VFHFGGRFAGGSNLNQFALSDPRALTSFRTPGLAIFDEFRPERVEPALGRLSRVYGAAVGSQKVALTATGLAKTKEMAVAYDVLGFKIGWYHADKLRRAHEVALRKIDESALAAALCAARLAGETECVHFS